jgi:hypothetical protein
LAVLAALCGPAAPQRDPVASDALGLLALVAGQDVEPADGSDGTGGRWVIARKVAPDRVISTVDVTARHTRKSRSQRRDGYPRHVATEPDTGLITDAEMTMATGGDNTDAAVGVRMGGLTGSTRETTRPTPETIKAAAEPGEPVVSSTSADTLDSDILEPADTDATVPVAPTPSPASRSWPARARTPARASTPT